MSGEEGSPVRGWAGFAVVSLTLMVPQALRSLGSGLLCPGLGARELLWVWASASAFPANPHHRGLCPHCYSSPRGSPPFVGAGLQSGDGVLWSRLALRPWAPGPGGEACSVVLLVVLWQPNSASYLRSALSKCFLPLPWSRRPLCGIGRDPCLSCEARGEAS